MNFSERQMRRLLKKWDFEVNFEFLSSYISTTKDDFDIKDRKDRKWLKKRIKSNLHNFQGNLLQPESVEPSNSQSFEDAQLTKYLKRWNLSDLKDYASSYLKNNDDIDLSEREDRREFRDYLKENSDFILSQPSSTTSISKAQSSSKTEDTESKTQNTADTDNEPELPKTLDTAGTDNEPELPETLDAASTDNEPELPETQNTADTNNETELSTPDVGGQAAVSVFGTNKNNNNLGEFFPEQGKVSSRMEKLFARLIETVQDKVFYVEYGDYTDPTQIKDPIISADGKFVFDGSGSREYKGGRVTGKGLNVVNPNYQGIYSETWTQSDTSLIRLSDAEWGKVLIEGELVEQVGRPKGYQGELYGVNNISTIIDPYDALTDSQTGELTNTRKISNILGLDEKSPANDNSLGYSSLHMAFGQYTDHNMSFLARTKTGQGLASEVDPNDLSDPLNYGFTGQKVTSEENPAQTGILGGRGEMYIVKDGLLVTVAYFDYENNAGKPAGWYEYDVNLDNSITARGELLLTNDAENRNKIVHRNRTEAMIQNNQLYGASDLQAYYLKESARYTEQEGDYVIYRDEIGNVYSKKIDVENGIEVGSIVRGTVLKNGEEFVIKNFRISSGVDANGNQIREQLFIDPNLTQPADILKTSHMLSSAAIGTDGLRNLPTYADLLLNNGVAPQLIKDIYNAPSDEQYFVGSMPNRRWLALTRDQNFIDFNNVEGYPMIGDISPRVFAESRTSGAMRGLDQNDDNIADAFAILKNEMPHLTVRDFTGQVVDLEQNLQPKINAEDWGTGLLLSHAAGGDWRANENAGLVTLHTLWAREHTFHVDWINSTLKTIRNNGEEKREFLEEYGLDLDDVTTEDVYNMARRMVEMEYQKVLYEQFAPSLVGDIAKIGKHGWNGFNPGVDASVAEEFSNGAYRFGHSQIQDFLIPGGELFDLFLTPQFTASYGFSGIINGMTQVVAAEVDTKVSESVRSNLLANKLDLKSANINRTRETGQANAQQLLRSLSGYDYVDGEYVFQVDESGKMKEGFAPLNLQNGSDVTKGILGADGVYGTEDDTPGLDYGFTGNTALKPLRDWADLGSRLRGNSETEKNDLLAGFMAVYDDSLNGDTVEDRLASAKIKIENGDLSYTNGLDQIDVWNFMLAEKPTGEQLLGPLASAIVWEQLDRFQDGDSAYYLNTLDGLGGGVWNHTLSPLEDIIARNSTSSTFDNYIDSGFSEDVFKTTPVQAELTDAITGIYDDANPFAPSSINNVDYLNGFVPGQGQPRVNDIDSTNPYVLEYNNAIYERVGANFANIASLWEANAIDPWQENNLLVNNTSASIDAGVRGQGGFVQLDPFA